MAGNTLRRKLAIASWDGPREANIYGRLTVDASEALAYLEDVRARTGEKVTVTHLVGKAVATALAAEPTLNGHLRFGRYVPHETVDLAFLVATADGSDLGKVKVTDVDHRPVADIAAALRQRADRLREGQDEDWERSKGIVRALPTWVLKPLLRLTGWLTAGLGIGARPLGLEAFPFGSAIVTSVGMFGLDEGFVPPTPFARVPLYVLIGAVREQAVVVDGRVAARPMLTITATVDHRFIDGFQGGVLAQAFRRAFEDPWSLDDDAWARAAPSSPPTGDGSLIP